MKWPARSAAYCNAHICLEDGDCSELLRAEPSTIYRVDGVDGVDGRSLVDDLPGRLIYQSGRWPGCSGYIYLVDGVDRSARCRFQERRHSSAARADCLAVAQRMPLRTHRCLAKAPFAVSYGVTAVRWSLLSAPDDAAMILRRRSRTGLRCLSPPASALVL